MIDYIKKTLNSVWFYLVSHYTNNSLLIKQAAIVKPDKIVIPIPTEVEHGKENEKVLSTITPNANTATPKKKNKNKKTMNKWQLILNNSQTKEMKPPSTNEAADFEGEEVVFTNTKNTKTNKHHKANQNKKDKPKISLSKSEESDKKMVDGKEEQTSDSSSLISYSVNNKNIFLAANRYFTQFFEIDKQINSELNILGSANPKNQGAALFAAIQMLEELKKSQDILAKDNIIFPKDLTARILRIRNVLADRFDGFIDNGFKNQFSQKECQSFLFLALRTYFLTRKFISNPQASLGNLINADLETNAINIYLNAENKSLQLPPLSANEILTKMNNIIENKLKGLIAPITDSASLAVDVTTFSAIKMAIAEFGARARQLVDSHPDFCKEKLGNMHINADFMMFGLERSAAKGLSKAAFATPTWKGMSNVFLLCIKIRNVLLHNQEDKAKTNLDYDKINPDLILALAQHLVSFGPQINSLISKLQQNQAEDLSPRLTF